MSAPLRAVVFDFYGTLARPMAADWWPTVPGLVAAAGGTLRDEAFARWARIPVAHAEHSATKERYDAWSRERLDDLLGSCGLEAAERARLAELIEAARQRELVSLADGAAAAIDELRGRGLLVALCSNWDWDLDRQLAGNGVADHFDAVVCSARAGYRKPHHQIFDLVLDALSVPAAEVLFVGDDWEADIEGATSAGMAVVHAGWAVPCERTEHAEVPCCASLDELLAHRDLAGAAHGAADTPPSSDHS